MISVTGSDVIDTWSTPESASSRTGIGRPVDAGHATFGMETTQGSLAVQDGVLVLRGDIDGMLCERWLSHRPTSLDIVAVDARRVSFLSSAGLALLAGLARRAGTPLPLWASERRVLRPLQVAGLEAMFDVRRDTQVVPGPHPTG